MTEANPIKVTRVDHVVLRVMQLDKMIEFYCNVLGCRLERSLDDIGLAQLRAGDSLIDLLDATSEFGKSTGEAPDHSAHNVDHICLLIEPWNEDLIVDHLAQLGVNHDEISSRYGATGYGPSIYLKDPEGNTVELKGQA